VHAVFIVCFSVNILPAMQGRIKSFSFKKKTSDVKMKVVPQPQTKNKGGFLTNDK